MNRIWTYSRVPRFLTAYSARLRGFSLVELMVSIFLGLLIMAFVLSLFGDTIRSNRDVLASARLNQELTAVIKLMEDEIRRAGYTNHLGELEIYTDEDGNVGGLPDIALPQAGCILYAYNQDGDLASDSSPLDPQEYRGFKLEEVNGVAFVMMRTSGDNMANCDGSDDNWEPLTDPAVIHITQLNFSTDGVTRCVRVGQTPVAKASEDTLADFDCGASPATRVIVREVVIQIAGEIVNEASSIKTTKGIETTVKVRNNRVRI